MKTEPIRVYDGRPTRVCNAWGDREPYGEPDRAVLGRAVLHRSPLAFLDHDTRRAMVGECWMTAALPDALPLAAVGGRL